MGKSGGAARNIFFWNFQRGTIPYDILCGLILAFVFFVPRSCFAPKPKTNPSPNQERAPHGTLQEKNGQLPPNLSQQGK